MTHFIKRTEQISLKQMPFQISDFASITLNSMHICPLRKISVIFICVINYLKVPEQCSSLFTTYITSNRFSKVYRLDVI